MADKLNNIMLDLETLGNGSDAAIIQLAAVFFDPLTGETGAEFNMKVNFDDAVRNGSVTGSTIQWWLEQSKEAQNAVVPTDEAPSDMLGEVIREFTCWAVNNAYGGASKLKVWGNGATFDNVVLTNAFNAVGIARPWKYSNDRDVRTVVALCEMYGLPNHKYGTPFEGIKHNAIDDCKHQIRYVSKILSSVGKV